MFRRNILGFVSALILFSIGWALAVFASNSEITVDELEVDAIHESTSIGLMSLIAPLSNSDFLLNLGTELIGAAVTFVLFTVVVDDIRQRRQRQERDDQEIQQLIENITDPNSITALKALEQLKKRDLLKINGSRLQGEHLRGVNWENAQLSECGLQEANLSRANLKRANLRAADLTGAVLVRTDLSGSDLSGAVLDNIQIDDHTNFSGATLDEEYQHLIKKSD